MDNGVYQNFPKIIKNLASYLPSRVLIILNSIVIIPLLARAINHEEMSIYLLAIQILNLVCTCSTDGIGKAVLRFYEKYHIQEKLDLFFSSILWLFVGIYVLTWILFFFFKDILVNHFSISYTTAVITLMLIIPCGIRQILYQILRAMNHIALYTWSIFFYQAMFVTFFLTVSHLKSSVSANIILIAMACAIALIDVLILLRVTLEYKIKFFIDKEIFKEILTYLVPLFFTNVSYWFVLNVSKFMFQNAKDYTSTSIFGLTWQSATWMIGPILTVFIFASFPVLVKKFELKQRIRTYFTNLLQLYFFLLIPLLSIFFLYSKSITAVLLPESYASAWILFPFFATSMCLHELTKLINIKYHLQNKIYIELCLGIIVAIISYAMNVYLIEEYKLTGAAIALLLSELLLLGVNMFVKFQNFGYINYKKIFKTLSICIISSICIYEIVSIPFINASKYWHILEIAIYLSLNYGLCFKFRQKIL